MRPINRRAFLQRAAGLAAGGGAFLFSGCTGITLPRISGPTQPANEPTQSPAGTPPAAQEGPGVESGFNPDVEIVLNARQREQQILPGSSTVVWSYQGTLVKGDSTNLLPLQDSYLGPIIHVRKGQKVRVRFSHDLPEPSIIHWHGLIIPGRMDGHPRDAIQPGQTYVYEFEVANRAGTYWYHPHPEPLTGSQVIRGLAGLFIVSDDEEAAAGLPSGEYDIPLVIQDRTFDENNQIVYVQDGGLNEMEGMQGMPSMEKMMGFLGERIMVNGHATPLLPAATRAYRLRLLNGSNSRVFKLGWSTGAPMIVLATDGGLLESPVQRPYVMLGPGERIEVWADFRQIPVGTEITLQSLPFLGAEGDSLAEGAAMPGMGAGTEHGNMPGMNAAQAEGNMPAGAGGMGEYNPKLPNGAGFTILHVRVERQEQESLALPVRLSTINRYSLDQAVNARHPRRFGLTMRQGIWLINGRAFQMEEAALDEIVKLNTLEAWDFVNEKNTNETMEKNGMVHPIHIHGVQFQVVGRQVVAPELQAGWNSVYEGYIDEGWKDTVLVMPGEQVRLLLQFDYPDLFLYHCHNLEHEDLGMMRNYRVDP